MASCTSPSVTPAPTRAPMPARARPHKTQACSTARSSVLCRRPANRPRATRSVDRARPAADFAATPRRRPPRRAKRCTPGVCATRSGSPSTRTPDPTDSSSTMSASTHEKRSTSAVSAATTAGRSARESALSTRTRRAYPPTRRRDSPNRSPTTRTRWVSSSPPERSSPTVTGRHRTTVATCSPMGVPASCGCAVPMAASTIPTRSRPASARSPTWPSSRPTTASPCTTRRAVVRCERSRRRPWPSPTLARLPSSPRRRGRPTGCSIPAWLRPAPSGCAPTARGTCHWVSIRRSPRRCSSTSPSCGRALPASSLHGPVVPRDPSPPTSTPRLVRSSPTRPLSRSTPTAASWFIRSPQQMLRSTCSAPSTSRPRPFNPAGSSRFPPLALPTPAIRSRRPISTRGASAACCPTCGYPSPVVPPCPPSG